MSSVRSSADEQCLTKHFVPDRLFTQSKRANEPLGPNIQHEENGWLDINPRLTSRDLNFGRNVIGAALDMSKSVEYRRYADECRSLAEKLKPGDGRAQLLDIAAAWDSLASEHERRFDRGSSGLVHDPLPRSSPSRAA